MDASSAPPEEVYAQFNALFNATFGRPDIPLDASMLDMLTTEAYWPPRWKEVLTEFCQSELPSLKNYITSRAIQDTLWQPRPRDVFNHFWMTPPEDVKVVLMMPTVSPERRHPGNVPCSLGYALGHLYQNSDALEIASNGAALASYSQQQGKERDDNEDKPPTVLDARAFDRTLFHWAKQGVLLMNLEPATTTSSLQYTRYKEPLKTPTYHLWSHLASVTLNYVLKLQPQCIMMMNGCNQLLTSSVLTKFNRIILGRNLYSQKPNLSFFSTEFAKTLTQVNIHLRDVKKDEIVWFV